MSITRRNHGAGHSYIDEHGHKVPGVTTLISAGLPKKALEHWKVEVTADYAIDHWDELLTLKPSERRKRMMKAQYERSRPAAARGSKVHRLADQLAAGKPVAVPEGLEGYVDACVAFLDDFDVHVIHAEFTCYSETNKHAGTGDLIADLLDPDDPEPDPALRGRVRWLLDYKTSDSGVYGETALQLAGYRYSETLVDDAGTELDMPEVDRCGVVHLRSDGTYALVPLIVGEPEYRQFLYVAETARWLDAARDLVGEPIDAPALPARTEDHDEPAF